MDNNNSFTDTMEIEDETMDSHSEYSNDEKYKNYEHLVETIKFFQTEGRITEDWIENEKHVIERWRDWIYDFSELNLDVQDKTFRRACRDAESLISFLMNSIRTTKTFDPKVYYILLVTIKFICDDIFNTDSLDDMMRNIGI